MSETSRQAGAVEVTREMADAGFQEFLSHDLEGEGIEATLTAVFRAMLAARALSAEPTGSRGE